MANVSQGLLLLLVRQLSGDQSGFMQLCLEGPMIRQDIPGTNCYPADVVAILLKMLHKQMRVDFAL